MASKVLVVGGAGYVGSHMVLLLREAGWGVLVLDDLSSGRAEALLGADLVVGGAGDAALLDRLFAGHRIEAVMHFASLIQVGESVRDPARYYATNVAATLTLLDAVRRHRVPHFVFSSSAAVFGDPGRVPVDEEAPTRPVNPYGRTKWMVEQVLMDYDSAYGLRSASLRYFNAAGTDPQGRIGECHEPETHLIPLVLQAAAGRRPAVTVFGSDYDTPDGTCIRDYVHVVDLCAAHLLALQALRGGARSGAYNLGNGNGFSVRQVIDAAETVTGKPVPVRHAARRPGDPPRLVADASAARRALGWQPRYPDLATIIEHAWRWEQAGRRPRPTRTRLPSRRASARGRSAATPGGRPPRARAA